MILSDYDILRNRNLGNITIEPFNVSQLQPASYDVTLSGIFKTMKFSSLAIDPYDTSDIEYVEMVIEKGDYYRLDPGCCALSSTNEKIGLNDEVAARFEGKSSLGRLFLLTHITAGFIDPGFTGHVTVEIKNVGPRPIKLWRDMRIGQISFTSLFSVCSNPYGSDSLGSKYNNQALSPQESLGVKNSGY